MVGAICVGGSAVVTESSIFVSSVLSISIPAGCNNLGLVFGDKVVDLALVFGVELVTVDVVADFDVVEAVEVVVCVSVFSMVLGSDSVVSSVVVSVVVVASVVVSSSVTEVDVVVITVVGLVIGSVDVIDFVDVASRSFCSIISESISKYVSGLNSNPNISIRSSN